jgi:hypothetical protein
MTNITKRREERIEVTLVMLIKRGGSLLERHGFEIRTAPRRMVSDLTSYYFSASTILG